MSVKAYFYLGPYILIKKEVVDSFYMETRCGNEDCSRKKKVEAKFCPDCGKPTVNVKVPTKINKEYNLDNLHEHFNLPIAGGFEMSKDYDIFTDVSLGYNWNENDMGQWMAMYIDQQPSGTDNNIYPGDVIKEFKEKHAEIITKLRENGAEVLIYYGVVIHGN